jgi:hypothetical protein
MFSVDTTGMTAPSYPYTSGPHPDGFQYGTDTDIRLVMLTDHGRLGLRLDWTACVPEDVNWPLRKYFAWNPPCGNIR